MLGIEKSSHDTILVLDCDLQHDIHDANLMIKKFLRTNSDLTIGSRFLNKKYTGNLSFFRSSMSLMFIILINFFFEKKTSDPLSGFFVSKKKIILKNKKEYFLRGYKILFDIIYNSKQNLKINEIQINFKKRNDGISKLNFKVLNNFIKQLFFTYRKKFFIKNFLN